MSAIAGLWHLDGRPDAGELLDRMQRAQFVFGRDRAGAWDGGDIALGSLLSHLLPEDAYDRQPVTGGDGRFVLVADLRLDNRPELTEALGLDRQRAAGMADSDMLMAAWERWGVDCLARLTGNFAFALWDGAERRLHLVRDHLAERPLFYHQRNGRIAFASMYHGLHALPDVPLEPDLAAVRAFAGYFKEYSHRTYHTGIKRLERGTRLEIDCQGRTRLERYWDLPDPAPLRLGSDRDYVEMVLGVFDRAVRDRLRASGPIASHLSAGYDSSAVTATAAAILAGRGQRLTAYTGVPMDGVPLPEVPGRILDEGPVAAITAARYPNIDHVLAGRDGRAIGEDFGMFFDFSRRPLPNPGNMVWIVDIWKMMQQRGERVLLTGKMGNATISYKGKDWLPHLLATGRWWRLAQELGHLRREEGALGPLLQSTYRPLMPLSLIEWRSRIAHQDREARQYYSPLTPEAFARLRQDGAGDGSQSLYLMVSNGMRTRRMMIAGVISSLDASVVKKAALGAFSVDERDPSGDRRVVELILSLPPELFLRHGQWRWIYSQAFASRVPSEVLALSRSKGIQTADWMHRLIKGRAALNAVLDRAEGNAVIASMIDLAGLRRLARMEWDVATSQQRDIIAALKRRFLIGIATADYLLRCSVG